jgi:hypothetical protein
MRNGFRPQRGASVDYGVDAMSFTAHALPAAQAQTPRRIALTEPAQEIANGRRAYAQWFIRPQTLSSIEILELWCRKNL